MSNYISIIIPSLMKRDLKPTLESIKNQNCSNYITYIIPDIHKKGVAYTLNNGICGIESEYVFICNDDIVLYPHCLEVLSEALQKNKDCSFAYCDFYWNYPTRKKHFMSKEWNYKELQKGNYISEVAMIRRKDICSYSEHLKRLVDWDFWLRMGKGGEKGIYVKEILFEHNDDMKGISSEGNYEHYKKIIYSLHGIK